MTTTQKLAPRSIRLSMPSLMLRLEGLAMFIAALGLYGYLGHNWLAFVVFLLTPDVTFAVYALNKDAGRIAYNLAHFYGFSVLLGALSVLAGAPLGLQIALIWIAHISMDRTVSYGLKYPGLFKDTHLQHV